MSKINVESNLNEQVCTGCGVCMAICPVGAIKLTNNKLLSPIRSVDAHKCISCSQCIKLCPQLNSTDLIVPQKCYAQYPKEKDKRFSSGGAATLIAISFMEKYKGVVCGCAWDRNECRAKHIVCERKEELYRLCGSKYVQSDISEALNEIKNYIKIGRNVLFIGTPCQVDAVKSYCGSENLYTADLICHGTPPAKYLTEYIKTLPNTKQISEISFRGENDFYLTAKDMNKKTLYRKFNDCDAYFHAFLKGVIYRENCYDCRYAQVKRAGDVTLGDFWELNRETIEYEGNISLILSNTDKGETLISHSRYLMVIEERDIQEAINGNLQLSAPMLRTDDYYDFKNTLELTRNFTNALKKTKTYKEVQRNKKKVALNQKKYKLKLFLIRMGFIKER